MKDLRSIINNSKHVTLINVNKKVGMLLITKEIIPFVHSVIMDEDFIIDHPYTIEKDEILKVFDMSSLQEKISKGLNTYLILRPVEADESLRFFYEQFKLKKELQS